LDEELEFCEELLTGGLLDWLEEVELRLDEELEFCEELLTGGLLDRLDEERELDDLD
jgi:hypothetical protein